MKPRWLNQFFSHFLVVLGSLALCACAVGPDYQAPKVPVPENFVTTGDFDSGTPLLKW